MQATLLEIADLVQGTLCGEASLVISGLAAIDDITEGALVFALGTENLKKAEASTAAAILVPQTITESNKPIIQVADPLTAFMSLLEHFYPRPKALLGIHPTAVIADDAHIGVQVSIGPYVVIESGVRIGNHVVLKSHVHVGANVTIGDDTCVHAHVTLYDGCQLGNKVIIHANTVIGSDGFGYNFAAGKHLKFPHVGNVIIGDEVEIGANSVVDRATVGSTEIGEGTKIDNLVQVAHSVKLGKHNILCAFTGIAGSTTTGNHVICAANVGVSDHVKIDDGVVLGARTGVPPKKHLKQGLVYLGSPSRPKDKFIETEMATARLPILRKNVLALTEKVNALMQRLEQLEKEATS